MWGVYDLALRGVTEGGGVVCVYPSVMSFIFIPDNFILPCRLQNGVPASQHLKVVGNDGC